MRNRIPFLFVLVLFLTGCVAALVGGAAVGGAGAAYYRGKLTADISAMPTAIAQATKRAFHVLAVAPEKFEQTELDAIITGHTANDEKITVKIKRMNDAVSQLEIRVGIFGDETTSRLIYEEIVRQLKHPNEVQTYAVTPPPSTPHVTNLTTTPPTSDGSVLTPTITTP